MDKKTCCHCGLEKDVDQFVKGTNRCKECAASISRETRKNDRDRIKADHKKYEQSLKGRYVYSKGYHKTKSGELTEADDLTYEQFVEKFNEQHCECAACGKNLNETTYHLDHIVPIIDGGDFTKANIQFLCERCNLVKGTKHYLFMRANVVNSSTTTIDPSGVHLITHNPEI